MNQGGEAAEQIVRMSLNGAEVALRLTGSGAKSLAILLGKAIKKAFSGKKVRGKARLKSMLKNEKSLKIFAVNDKDLKLFHKEARKYGILYCILKDKKAKDGMTDLLVRSKDAAKVNRIFERFKLAAVDRADVENQIDILPAKNKRTEKDTEAFLDRLSGSKEKEQAKDPSLSRGRKRSLSEHSSRQGNSKTEVRPSVRQQLQQIRSDRAKDKNRIPQRERNIPGKTDKHQKVKLKKGKSR